MIYLQCLIQLMITSDQTEAPEYFSVAAQLSPSVYLDERADNASTTTRETVLPTTKSPASNTAYSHGPSPQHPQLVILADWMSAHPRHLSKYAIGYQKPHPSSSILLIRYSPSDMILWPTRVQRYSHPRGCIPTFVTKPGSHLLNLANKFHDINA